MSGKYFDGCIEKVVATSIDKVNKQVLSRAHRISNELRNSELQVMSGQRSGRIYRKPHSKATYQASAPGEPPAVRTGTLRRSFNPGVEGTPSGKSYTVKSFIKTDLKYATYLENGTSRTAPRPFKERILEKSEPRIKQIMSEPFL